MSATVLVTDAGRASAVAFMRSLGHAGYRVIAADTDARSPGLRSRHVAARVVHPSADDDPEAMLDALAEAVVRHDVDALVPVTDRVVLPLDQARARFEPLCALALPDTDALRAVVDKAATCSLAAELGVPLPRGGVATTPEEAETWAGRLGWPVVVKPAVSRRYVPGEPLRSFRVSYAGDRAALHDQVASLRGACAALVQEYYPGEAHGVELLLDDGRPLAAFQHRRIREVPITGGPSSCRESVPLDPVLYDHSVRLLSALRWTGLAMVEFKVGARGPVLIEVNGRIWGSLPLAVRSGMDFPTKLVELLLVDRAGTPARPDTRYRVHVRSRSLELELLWVASTMRRARRYPFVAAPARRAAVRVALGLANPVGLDMLARDDLGPGLAELAKLPRRVLAKAKAANATPPVRTSVSRAAAVGAEVGA